MLKTISSYRVEEEIARGGMGVIYRAVHTVFDEVVAIKAIFPELTAKPDFRERFVNEAKIQRRLQHPNIVQVREFLSTTNNLYIIMEYIDGETLAERLKRSHGPLPLKEALDIFRQALQGLAYAHSQSVIHRDIKPSNIIIPWSGAVKLTGFGIARAVEGGNLTKSGFLLGTPAYMAPEQIQGQKLTKSADIYSMGVTLYEMVTGRAPFVPPHDSDTDFPILEAHVHKKPPAPTELDPSLPPFVEAALTKSLAKKPEQRFPSCQDFEAALKSPEEAAKPPEALDTLAVIEVSRPASPPPSAPSEAPPRTPTVALPAKPREVSSPPAPPPSAPSETQPRTPTVALPAKVRTVPLQPMPAKPQPASRGKKVKYWIAASLAVGVLAGAAVWYSLSRKQSPVHAPVEEPPPPTASAPAEQTPATKKGSEGLPKSLHTGAKAGSATRPSRGGPVARPAQEPVVAASNASGQDDRYTAEDLKRLAGAGLTEQQILRLVRKRGINFSPTPRVLDQLRKGGVPESVLEALGSQGSPESHP